MSDVDSSAHAKRLAAISSDDGKSSFQNMTKATAPSAAMSGQAHGNEILAWLAGNRMRILDRNGDMRPRGRDAGNTDSVLSEAKPDDPIAAAQKRASVLADLHQESPKDPRVMAVFDADPIVAEDPSTGKLVTSRMLRARADQFDALLTLLGKPVLTRSARSWLAVHLSNAFTVLTEQAQSEWAQSEVRMEETRAFLTRRPKQELLALARQVGAIMEARDLWHAARAFSIAAHLGIGQEKKSAHIADLLDMRHFDT